MRLALWAYVKADLKGQK
jgi:hypothetical protein